MNNNKVPPVMVKATKKKSVVPLCDSAKKAKAKTFKKLKEGTPKKVQQKGKLTDAPLVSRTPDHKQCKMSLAQLTPLL